MNACEACVVEVVATIPDNEALTAQRTLARFGLALGRLERGTIHRFELEPQARAALLGTLPTLESLVNPNTQRLVVREGARPRPGEAWIAEAVGAAAAERASERVMRIAGRSLPGVRALPRATAWRAYDREGRPDPAAIGAACALLLCNPAFEEAMIG